MEPALAMLEDLGRAPSLARTDMRGRGLPAPGLADLVVFHGGGCADGLAAAAVAYAARGEAATYVPAVHGAPFEADVRGRHVVMLDFSLKYDDMARILDESASFVVLDHHASAEAALARLPAAAKVFEMGQSGCTLAWDYFFPDRPPPLFLRYVEDRDIWRWALRDSRAFSAGFAARFPPQFTLDALRDVSFYVCARPDDASLSAIVADGRVLVAETARSVAAKVRRATRFRLRARPGWTVGVVNASEHVSDVGAALCLDGADVGLVFTVDVGLLQQVCRVSLRSNSDEVDVAALATELGGGGHRRAAGFLHDGALADLLLPL